MSEKFKKASDDDDDELPSAPGWMTTYGDMMTLLMTFFILIMSFSTIEVEKFKAALGSLRGAFGILGDSREVTPEYTWFSPLEHVKRETIIEQLENLQKIIKANDLDDKIDIYESDAEIIIRIKDQVLFESGSALLKPKFLPILSKIAKMIVKDAQEIKVAGHTDDIPIHNSKYPSNWELSLARALSVVRYFVYREKIHPAKISVAGYSKYRPLVPNNSPENRAKNRRVEIYLKY